MPKGRPGNVLAERMSGEDLARFRGLVLRAVGEAGGPLQLGNLMYAVARIGGWRAQTDRRAAFVVAARRSLVEDGTLRVWRDRSRRNNPEMVELAVPVETLRDRVRAELVARRGEYIGRKVDVLAAIVCEIVERETR